MPSDGCRCLKLDPSIEEAIIREPAFTHAIPLEPEPGTFLEFFFGEVEIKLRFFSPFFRRSGDEVLFFLLFFEGHCT